MNSKPAGELMLSQLQPDVPYMLPDGGFVTLKLFTDRFDSRLHLLTVSNGRLVFTVILERGMDIGELRLESEKISWERDIRYWDCRHCRRFETTTRPPALMKN